MVERHGASKVWRREPRIGLLAGSGGDRHVAKKLFAMAASVLVTQGRTLHDFTFFPDRL